MLTIEQDESGPDGGEERSHAVVRLPDGTAYDRRARVVPARPDAGFVTHLIATAEQLPQTRTLRRAAPADVHSAYAARLQPSTTSGERTRQVV
ncbi:hypothetical protein ACQR16_04305 [Bradyrhizobium oligotrophicum]|uniref:hypothetical protein n=1 Tax=Bradyrhizobium oligotrophicum TaxID=44255 RepID=UPI003EBFA40F